MTFTQDIQSIFEAKCHGCHGPQKQKSDFRLDLKSAATKGGQHGAPWIPGKSAESLLIHYVGGLIEDTRMPPPQSGVPPLSPEEISLLRAWIDQGAEWPEDSGAASMKRAVAKKLDFWTFHPATRPALPLSGEVGWARNEVDLFILDRLTKEGLAPSPEADKRTLLRRLSFDLTGLPPAPAAVDEFLADTAPGAYERLVERLLASPRYGERWARYWLDTVHYGESHGYDKDKPRTNAWPYRDYVIRSLNQDKAYSRFVQEQLAGDVLYPDEADGVVALGFIAAGPWDFVGHVELPESKTDGLIARYNDRDDMVMTTMSTFQSLTVHCARCHDHKFDPITQEEYYRLQAVFAGVDRADRWFDPDPARFRQRKELLAERKALAQSRDNLEAIVQKASPRVLKLIANRTDELKSQLAALDKAASEESPSNGYHTAVAGQADAEKWVQIDLGQATPLDEIRLIPARPTDFADTPGFGFPTRFRVELADESDFGNRQVILDATSADYANPGDHPVVIQGEGKRARFIRVTATRLWERTHDYVFALAELQALSGGQNVAAGKTVTALDSIESVRWSMKYLVDGFASRRKLDAPAAPDLAEKRQGLVEELQQLGTERATLVDTLVDARTKAEIQRVDQQLKGVNDVLAGLPAPQKVFAAASDFSPMGSFKPATQPRPVHLLRRGEVKQPVRLVDCGALSCLPGLYSDLPVPDSRQEGARRAALAKWITDPKNLMTRRSLVNRVWQYHFGRGIIDTPNDFGHMGSPPTHPELLDWLAFWFLDHGESIKSLHRLLVTSATYRQASTDQPAHARIDSDNRFLWRMNRVRLDAESLRDAILFVSGQLDLTEGGPSVQQFYFKDDHSPVYDYTQFDQESPAARRRAIYRFVVRSVPDPLMETLDCPDPSLLAPKRTTTVTALQALSLWNDPFVLHQARHFAERLATSGADLESQVADACHLAFGRPGQARELEKLIAYTRKHGLANLCRVILNSSEFVFVD